MSNMNVDTSRGFNQIVLLEDGETYTSDGEVVFLTDKGIEDFATNGMFPEDSEVVISITINDLIDAYNKLNNTKY